MSCEFGKNGKSKESDPTIFLEEKGAISDYALQTGKLCLMTDLFRSNTQGSCVFITSTEQTTNPWIWITSAQSILGLSVSFTVILLRPIIYELKSRLDGEIDRMKITIEVTSEQSIIARVNHMGNSLKQELRGLEQIWHESSVWLQSDIVS